MLSNFGAFRYNVGKLDEALEYAENAIALHPKCNPVSTFMLYTNYAYFNGVIVGVCDLWSVAEPRKNKREKAKGLISS